MTLSPEMAGLIGGFFVQALLVAYSYGRLREAVSSIHFRLDGQGKRIRDLEVLHTRGATQAHEN